MTYLNNTRLMFSGTFQADVSTVNNDIRHFDNAKWEPRFQELQKNGGTKDGWWNPVGSSAFRLIDCRVSSVHYADGTGSNDPVKDPAVALLIAGTNERVAAKLVDLDPQWQMCSQIWGLGCWQAASARTRKFPADRLSRPADRGAGPSSNFQSVLDRVEWSADASNSRALRELKGINCRCG